LFFDGVVRSAGVVVKKLKSKIKNQNQSQKIKKIKKMQKKNTPATCGGV
jgi:hypothetical protein